MVWEKQVTVIYTQIVVLITQIEVKKFYMRKSLNCNVHKTCFPIRNIKFGKQKQSSKHYEKIKINARKDLLCVNVLILSYLRRYIRQKG